MQEETLYQKKLSTYINSYLQQSRISHNSFMTFDLLQRMSYYVYAESLTIYNAFLNAIRGEEIDPSYKKYKLSTQLSFIMQKFQFAEYRSEDFHVDEICQQQMQQRRPQILNHLDNLTTNNLLRVLSVLGMYFSVNDYTLVMQKNYDFVTLTTEQILVLQGAASRFVSILIEWQYCKFNYSYVSYEDAVRWLEELNLQCILRGQQPHPIVAIRRSARVDAHLRYAQEFDYDYFRECLDMPNKDCICCSGHGQNKICDRVTAISDKLCLFRQLNSCKTVFDFKYNASLRDISALLRHEPYRRILASRNFVCVNRQNQLIEYMSYIIANTGSLEKAGLFAKQDFRVRFVGERGADGGGLRREFLYAGISEMYKPEYALFSEYANGKVWVNNFYLLERAKLLKAMRFFGMFLGICVLNQVCVDNRLPLGFYKIIACLTDPKQQVYSSVFPQRVQNMYQLTYDDVRDLDEDLYNNTLSLLTLRRQNVNLADLELYFCVTENVMGTPMTLDLIKDGYKKYVTNENVEEYVHLRMQFELLYQYEALLAARYGFYQVIPQFKLSVCAPFQLFQIISGVQIVDFTQLRAVTRYDRPYSETHPVIENFWAVLNGFEREQKEQFLQFIFCSARVPVNGFSQLIIEREGDFTAFPCAHTCSRTLCLPPYRTIDEMREKLLFAVQNCSGFGVI